MIDTIKNAAVDLFGEVGAGFTLDQLQQRTGLSRATLYRRIGSKDRLLEQLINEKRIVPDARSDIDERVFSATRRVVADRGFVACTMEQIAAEAGIGIATLYRRFADKESLLERFVARLGPKMEVRALLRSGNPDLVAVLEQVIGIGLRFYHDNPDLVKIVFSMKSAERRYLAEIRRDTTSTFACMCDFLRAHQDTGLLRGDVSASDLALGLNGLMLQYSAFAPAYLERRLDPEKDAAAILKMFLGGALSDGGGQVTR